ncbi:hypothetical protein OUZ56_017648 [Daphnia magna]|uniref:Uncharacterized protein n=1 Tax=Daphnia magna TaxID=35525 RepID=A0ABR0ATB5_9CRUS|nr:hypothetical protein OUZ56_017648 [Daphnia magna]
MQWLEMQLCIRHVHGQRVKPIKRNFVSGPVILYTRYKITGNWCRWVDLRADRVAKLHSAPYTST